MLREIAPWNSVFLWKMKRTVARSWNSHWEQKRTRTKSQLRQRRLWLSSWRELWMLYRYWTLGGYAVTHLSSYLPGAGHRFESRWSPNFFRLLLQTGRDGTSNAMFDELAERSLMSPLAGTKHTYVRLAIIIHCQILLSNCLNWKFTATIILHFHLQPQFTYELFHIYFTLKTACCFS